VSIFKKINIKLIAIASLNISLWEIRGSLRNKGSFYFGPTKILKNCLRKNETQKKCLNMVLHLIKGKTACFFTSLNLIEINEIFLTCEFKGFLKTGDQATSSFELTCGSTLTPTGNLPHTLEPQLRKCGLPSRLNSGVIEILRDYVINKKSEKLTPEQATLLKLLGEKQGTFRISPIAVWDSTIDSLFSYQPKNKSLYK
jgi:mRNA turnover protein 4